MALGVRLEEPKTLPTNHVVPAVAQTPEQLIAANVTSGAAEGLGTFIGPALTGLLLVISGPIAALLAVVLLAAVVHTQDRALAKLEKRWIEQHDRIVTVEAKADRCELVGALPRDHQRSSYISYVMVEP